MPTKKVKDSVVLKDKRGKPIIKNGEVQEKKVEKIVAIDQSGVTISSGFDIDQHNRYDLNKIFKTQKALLELYLPYASKKKQIAIDFLAKKPLEINEEQAILTDKLVKQAKTDDVIAVYNKYEMPISFKNQSIGVQTVVMSICYQYGSYNDRHKPIWEALEKNDFDLLYEFWDKESKTSKYYKRRGLEFEFLKSHINDYEN